MAQTTIKTEQLADDAVTSAKLDTNIAIAGTLGVASDVTLTSATSTKPHLIIKNTNADGGAPQLQFIKDSSSPADNDEIGRIYMYGDDDAGNPYEGVLIRGIATDVSNGSEDTTLEFFTQKAGSQASTLALASGNVGIGTASPARALSTKSSSVTIGNFESTSSSGGLVSFSDANTTDDVRVRVGAVGDNLVLQAGGAERMRIDSSGHVTMPHQSAFSAKVASQINNIAINGIVGVAFGTEIFDQNADYNTNGNFTAPVTGRYLLNVNLNFDAYPDDNNYLWTGIVTSNRTYYLVLNPPGAASSNYENAAGSVLADMDANDTAYVFVLQSGGTAQTDILVDSFFSGHLVC